MPFLIPFIPLILVGVSIASAGASAGIAIKQGQDQKKSASKAAKMEAQAGQMEAALRKNELSMMQSTIRANYAAMGGEATTGSGFALIQSNERKAQIDIGLASQARSQRAFQLKSEGANAKKAGLLTGIGSIASGASSAATTLGPAADYAKAGRT